VIRPFARIFSVLLLALGLAACKRQPQGGTPEKFITLMNAGKNYLDRGDATNAIVTFKKAERIVRMMPTCILNLANAYLAGDAAPDAIRDADEVLKLEPNSARQFSSRDRVFADVERRGSGEGAGECFQDRSRGKGDPVSAWPGRMGLQQWDAAIAAFKAGLAMDPNHLHAGPRYLIAQALMRAGRQAEADRELQSTRAARKPGRSTRGRSSGASSPCTGPIQAGQRRRGIKVKFVDATKEVLDPCHR